jgi:uncharacterized membrane protein HdeD (DUF308 family)
MMKNDNVKLIWGILMTLIYLFMAILLIFSDIFDFDKTLKIIIGILFFVYGVFRGYRVWKNI